MRTGLIAAAALAVVSVGAVDARAMDVRQVSLWYKVSEKSACPRKVMMRAHASTDGPGTVRFVFRKAGGGKSGEFAAQAKKGSDGKYAATYTQIFTIQKNTRTKYMVDAGPGKISPWIDFNETCGPQPRKESKTKGPPPRQGRHISELDKDAEPSGNGKPAPSSGGKPLPSGKGKAVCRGPIEVKRLAATTRATGVATAWAAWKIHVQKKYGAKYASILHADDKKTWCNGAVLYNCTVSARPCVKG